MRPVHIIAAAIAASILVAATPKSQNTTAFAAGAADLWQRMWPSSGPGGPVPIKVASPDGKTVLTATYDDKAGVILQVRSNDLNSSINIGPGVQSAVEWSPNSKAFFLTTSDDGANGWYHTLVYIVTKHRIKRLDPTPLVLAAFGHPVKCGWPEDPNIGAIKWLSNSRRLLLAAEIIGHTNCDSYGTFKAYEVALPELKIVRTYGQIEVKQLFHGSLGWEIENAPDNCIRDPKSCWVEGNHNSRQ